MVAILAPRPDDTAGRHPRATTSTEPAPARSPAVGPPARRLPDRSTRVRRRRLAALVATVLLVGAIATTASLVVGAVGAIEPTPPQPIEAPAPPRPSPEPGEVYVVQPGDTLWSIATRLAPGSDPRGVVDALRAANGGPDLQVGARLTLTLD
jgi:hypothetical protein